LNCDNCERPGYNSISTRVGDISQLRIDVEALGGTFPTALTNLLNAYELIRSKPVGGDLAAPFLDAAVAGERTEAKFDKLTRKAVLDQADAQFRGDLGRRTAGDVVVRAGAILADGGADAILASARPTFHAASQTIEEGHLDRQPVGILLDGRRGHTRAKSLILQRDWGAEQRHHPVAGVLHGSAVAAGHRRRPLQQLGHDLAQPLDIQRGRDVHRPHHIGVKSRDVVYRGRRVILRLRGSGGQCRRGGLLFGRGVVGGA
jgi:hypothetical protein